MIKIVTFICSLLWGCSFLFGQSASSWSTGGNANLDPNCYIGTSDSSPLHIKTGGTTKMKIESSGDVKVSSLAGTGRAYVTVGPNGTLQRSSDPGQDSLFDCSQKVWKADGNFLTADCFLGSINDKPVRILTNNSERMRISKSGHVGIGTTAPLAPLQIGQDQPFTISSQINGMQVKRYLLGFNARLDGGQIKRIHNGTAGYLQWDAIENDVILAVAPQGSNGSSANLEAMAVVKASGNFGIGTRDPLARLHVYQPGGQATVRVESGDPLLGPSVEFWAGPFGVNGPHAQLAEIKASYDAQTGKSGIDIGVNPGQSTTTTSPILSLKPQASTFHTAVGIGIPASTADRLAVDGSVRIHAVGQSASHLRLQHDGTDAIIEYQTSTSNNNGSSKLSINPGGQKTEFGGDVVVGTHLGLGTDNFYDASNGKTYRLSVDGRIRAREVKVYSGWADYVFEPGYELMPLSEIEAYIKENGHLPGVPSAQEVEQNGADVGETQALLLAKIEELTLHLIRLEKENAELRQQVKSLKYNK